MIKIKEKEHNNNKHIYTFAHYHKDTRAIITFTLSFRRCLHPKRLSALA